MEKMKVSEFVSALLSIANFYEQHPDMPLPYLGPHLNVRVDGKEEMAKAVRAFGECEKKFDDTYAQVVKDFGGIKIAAYDFRDNVCERVVTGTKHVEEVIIPGRPSEVVPAHDEDIFEWKCPGSLLAEA